MDGKNLNINSPCPLCLSKGNVFFYSDSFRDYYRCSKCNLIHVPPSTYLSKESELAEYNKHQNSPEDTGYRKFLSRLFNPVNSRLSPGSRGLDFGSGPGPTLSVLFEEAGYSMDLYDPFYVPDKNVYKQQYDFITVSEVVEHLHNPAGELDQLWSILKPGGWLGVMTKLALDKEAFSNWHYKSDPTHVCFFSKGTMNWLAGKWTTEALYFGNDVVLFQKN
ncbi:MAG: class I SAM-dependent methyltransferase [Spirochaetaceae bacterium]|nr:class I SAM-dependent methyltransferase [Spirochaetaceae bacterium]